jgi:ribosomal protein S12 methylthiotransferase
VVVVNTCGFIDAAKEESLEAIGEALAENGKVVVTGCLGASAPSRSASSTRKCCRSAARRITSGAGARCIAQKPPQHDPFMDLVPPQGSS